MSVEILTQGGGATLQTRTVTPTSSTTSYNPSSRYDGFSSFTVTGDSNLISSNIKNGTTIFNVTGNYISPLTRLVPTKYSPSSSSLDYELKGGYTLEGSSVYWVQDWNPDYFDFTGLKNVTGTRFTGGGATYPATMYIASYPTSNTMKMGLMRPDRWNGNTYSSSTSEYLVFCYIKSGRSTTVAMNGGYSSSYGAITIDLNNHILKVRICSTSDYLYTCLNTAGAIRDSLAIYYNATNMDYISFYY